MAFVDIKNPAERNKLIAAVILGVVAIGALYFAFGRSFFGSKTTAASRPTPTPRPSASPGADNFKLPTAEEQNFNDLTTPVVYVPGNSYAPDPGRNIFAFYEPPPPTPFSPTPLPTPKQTATPTPTPTPFYLVGSSGPNSVYAGSRGFRLEVNGDHFTPDARIYFNQTEMPTTYINEQKLVTDIAASLIAQEGSRQIIVQSPDGKRYSNQIMLTVQAPPRPQFSYIGMIGRKRYNNDTAYFIENGKTLPFGARLNDVISGTFRLINITPEEAVFVDVNLGFKHRVPLSKGTSGGPSPSSFDRPALTPRNDFPPEGFGQPPVNQPDCPPGIPCNIPRAPTPKATRTPPDPKKDVDDNDGNGRGR